MDVNERFEYMAELFYKATGNIAPGKDSPSAFGVADREKVQKEWVEFVEVFYSRLFDLHKTHNNCIENNLN